MAYTLVIVESPAKCQKIEKYLGVGYKCIASYGHIQELIGLKSINLETFIPNFTPMDSKRQQIERIRQMITNSNDVLLATDDDREGEGIAWHICKLFDLSFENTKRIIFHEVTETALKNSVKTPLKLNMNMVNAQQGRQILDLLVGYKISPLLWENISRTKKGLSR
jgi:DNA topoisomerase-1